MSELYMGLMSGTSIDGIDAALVDFSPSVPRLLDSYYLPYETTFRQSLLNLCHPGENEINRLGEMDSLLGKQFARAATHLLRKNQLSAKDISAIGCHGQTIRHHPARQFTLQIGDPNIIAAETGITTIADFRRRDMAYGGQGAPLVPAFHQAIFRAALDRAIVNIGGIANVTFLPKDNQPAFGFDTGPGNTLLDAWAEKNLQKPRDDQGNWARAGQLQKKLLHAMLEDSYFKQPGPKSSGRDYFNLSWLEPFSLKNYQPVDVQATLTELTAQSILNAIEAHFPTGEILLCGGGIHNTFLVERLRKLSSTHIIESTEKVGIHPDWMEAIAFAWLARQTFRRQPGNLTAVTGARQTSILGGVYFA
ncbi:MAG TPA: anhydro-N-acetylmuramic acid kinase [Gammaproteobacteria bacterium]|nr:anhydro-N-acetylmuramic acid kinase [Gammaproteobacteria bacterium]